ncbi:hypothetical protein FSP39_024050 [Pinctada imbricata]|uniref:Uncharacterized protein n=1 Tax=Pinctada imbricata TaxID=66713 RepID=A0AA88YG60_PINIB|nr:hypothetical protein FSP39_024050 [Pinctada imbricata]
MECGSGMNLHLDNNNPFCKCKLDSVYIPPGYGEFRPSRGFPLRPKSSYNSPRPTSASSPSQPTTPNGSQISSSALSITSTTITKDKVLLRYTDGGIKRPITPMGSPSTNALPRIVRKYIGRRDFGEFVGVALGGLTGAILVIIICLACCVAIRKGKPDPLRSSDRRVFRDNGTTGHEDLSRTFTLGQRGNAAPAYSGYMMDLAMPPPAYEHVVLEARREGGETQPTEQNNNSTNIPQRNDGNSQVALNTVSERVQQRSEGIASVNDSDMEMDRIPRYQSVMRKGQWRNAGRNTFWTSVEDVTNQSTETLDSFVDLDEDTTNSTVTGISTETIDTETRISESNMEYVTHL